MRGVVIVPACNEEPSLAHFIPHLKAVGLGLDVVVIDDGSTDGTAGVARRTGCEVLINDQNLGIGASLRRGYAYAINNGYDVAVTMDSDGQHDPKLLPEFLAKLSEVDFATGTRYHPLSERRGTPLDRDLLNIAFVAILNSVTGWGLTDPLCGFWAMKRPVLEFLVEHIKLERYGSCLEALIKLWYLAKPRPSHAEIPHPAIYTNGGEGFLNRTYSPSNKEDRLDRFGTHAAHVLSALEDVGQACGNDVLVTAMQEWRSAQVSSFLKVRRP